MDGVFMIPLKFYLQTLTKLRCKTWELIQNKEPRDSSRVKWINIIKLVQR